MKTKDKRKRKKVHVPLLDFAGDVQERIVDIGRLLRRRLHVVDAIHFGVLL